MIPAPNTLWRFIGPGFAHGQVQRVITVAPDEVIAVSENSPKQGFSGLPVVAEGFPSYGWLGTPQEFAEQFTFLAGPCFNHTRK